MTTPVSSTEVLGARLLREVASEEVGLEDVRPLPSELDNPNFFILPRHVS